jgi:uncharacterized membrane protein
MIQDLLDLALGANRVLCYAGYVLLAGTLTFWCVVWPDGRRNRRLVMLALAGTTAMIMGTIAGSCHSADLRKLAARRHRHPTGWRRPAGQTRCPDCRNVLPSRHHQRCRGGLASHPRPHPGVGDRASMVVQSNAIGGPWEIAKIAATGLHVLATCAWLGGLLALATVLIPGEKVQELDQLIPRFSRVAQLSVVTLIVTGIVHALAVAGGVYQLAGSRYGLVLLIKVSIFGLMLLMGNEGRKYAARAAFRLQHQPPDVPVRAGGISTLAVVMGAELCIAFVILSTTSLLVMVAPHP